MIKDLYKTIEEAKMEALKQGIEANGIVINEKYKYVKPFSIMFAFGDVSAEPNDYMTQEFPAMLCGMYVLFDDIEEYAGEGTDFILTHFNVSAVKGRVAELEQENEKLKAQLRDIKAILGIEDKDDRDNNSYDDHDDDYEA